jgi:carbonic anhydrase
LLEGNQRYVRAGALRPNQSGERRLEVAAGQHPFALVLSCMDSRVPPELVFDQGLGDLFSVRVAGAVVEASIEGSIEYAAAKFGVQLVLVVGHTACGAVEATVEVMTEGGTAAGSIAELVTLIRPAVEAVQDLPGDLVDNAARANVRLTVAHLRASDPVLSKLVAVGALEVVGGCYDLETGVVEIIDR